MAPYVGLHLANYDSSLLATITKDGSNLVGTWADANASGYDLSQTSLKPTYVADDGDGLPCINFLDGNQLRNTTSTTQTEDTFFMVVKVGDLTSTNDYIWGRNNSLSGLLLSSTALDWQPAGSVDGVSAMRHAPAPVKNKYVILSGRRSASQNYYPGGTGNLGTIEVRENGAALKIATHTGGAVTGAMFMGRDTNNNSTAMKVRQAIWYKGWLTDAQMLAVEDFLNTKWSVYSNVAVRRALHRGVQRWMTANDASSPSATKPLRAIFGQSNSLGEALLTSASLLPAQLQGPITNALIWNSVTPAWETLAVGVNNDPNSTPTLPNIKHGAELAMMFDLATDFGASYLVKSGEGGTALVDRWMPTVTRTSNLWRVFIDKLDAARYAIGFTTGLELTPDYFTWYQGEADAALGGSAITNYATNEQIMLAATRAIVTGGAAIKYISVKVRDIAEPDADFDAVSAAKLANVSVIPAYQVINGWTTQSPAGGPHGDSASMTVIGNAIAAICGATTQV